MLAMLVMLMLVPSGNHGLLLKKCELKSQLEKGLVKFPAESIEDVIAKIVCTAEHTSGFDTSLITKSHLITSDEDYSSGMEELLSSNPESENDGEDVVGTLKPFTPLYDEAENKVKREVDEVQPEESSGHHDGSARKKREDPPKDDGDGSLMADDSSGEGSVEQYEGAQTNYGPPMDSVTKEPVEYDTDDGQNRKRREIPPNDEQHGSWMVEDSSSKRSIDQFDEMLSSPPDLPPKTTVEPIYYDTYEMLYGDPDGGRWEPGDYESNKLTTGQKDEAMNSLDTSQYTIGQLGSDTGERSKRSSEDQTTHYGIFQLSDRACNSGANHTLNLCGIDCSALTDDDITDDIACLITLNLEMMDLKTPRVCLSEEASHYFAECG